jgi:ketosteroid isomerase-like protein
MIADAHEEAEAQVRAAAAAWDLAMIRNDADAIGRFMADEWVIVGADGNLTDKASFLAQVRDGRLSHDTMTTEDARVRIYGDVAVLIARGVSAGRFAGHAFREHERQSNVFVRRAGQWRCVLTHLSSMQQDQSREGALDDQSIAGG